MELKLKRINFTFKGGKSIFNLLKRCIPTSNGESPKRRMLTIYL